MWVVANINNNQYSIFKNSIEKFGGSLTEIYFPKIILENTKKEKTKNLLGNYIFCFNSHFNYKKIKTLKYLKGLNYFLENSLLNQKDIKSFITLCKSFEDTKGTLKSSFFLNLNTKKFKFINGPSKSLFFKILETNKNKIFAETNNNKKIVLQKKNCIHFLSN